MGHTDQPGGYEPPAELGFDAFGVRMLTDCRVPNGDPNQVIMFPADFIPPDAPHLCTPDDRCDAWEQATRDGETPNQAPYTTTPDDITKGARRRLRQNLAMHNRRHPLLAIMGVTNQALHGSVTVEVELPIMDRRPTVTGPTCGDCRFRIMQGAASDRDYPKCFGFDGLNTHGESTDVRAWWPACHRFEKRAFT